LAYGIIRGKEGAKVKAPNYFLSIQGLFICSPIVLILEQLPFVPQLKPLGIPEPIYPTYTSKEIAARETIGQMISEFCMCGSDKNGFHDTFHLICSPRSGAPSTLGYPAGVTERSSSYSTYTIVPRDDLVKIYYNPRV